MDNTAGRISITPTIARQTPKNDFGEVLNNSLQGVLKAGALVGSLTGMPIISSAVSAVSSLVNSSASVTGATSSRAVINLGGASGGIGSVAGGGVPPGVGSGIAVGTTVQGNLPGSGMGRTAGAEPAGMNDMLSTMRAEADRSMMMQMQMQNESREYNTLTNILKLRHDSAKAAINNIR